MDISIMFNWPPGKNSASVSFSGPTVDETDCEFRVGIIKSNKVRWLKVGWIEAKKMHEIKFITRNDETVVVEKRKNNFKKIETRNKWNIREEWPDNAAGGSVVIVPWSFH